MPGTPISFDRSVIRDSREGSNDNTVTPGLVLAALITVLFLFGTRVFDTVKDSANISTQQARIEAPTNYRTGVRFPMYQPMLDDAETGLVE